jgi:DNA repair exonuclease SbcCD ATPase subunit
MIVFKKLQYRNFLSTGNSANTILLNKSHSTLVIGKNGEGKSTFLDAICFALFGKPFRNITKPQLINSINGKNLLVECEFSIGTKEYKIIRGMKPNVFEIWCDGVMLNQEAAAKDYQKVLEQQILRLNYKTFTQVVILGAASFVPFMQLPSGQRRDVIEDILDIRIFSVMNQMLKDKVQANKDEILRIEEAVTLAKEKVSAQKKLIATINEARDSTVEKLAAKINEALEQIRIAQEKSSALGEEVKTLTKSASKESSIKADLKKVTQAKHKLEARLDAIQERIDFMVEREDCPSCQQKIPHDHKQATIASAQEDAAKYEDEKATLEKCVDKLNKKLERITELNKELTRKNIELSTCNNTISLLNKHIADMNYEIREHTNDTGNIDLERQKLKELAEEAMHMLEMKTQLGDQKNLHDIAALLLKDTGIKTAIIREYLPVMNKLINKYLNIMDSYIHFELDESFNEVIKSRFRDEFTYASFSEGEKQRIDLAILFTWRQIAKMKNSVNTNLLIFDEIMDSSLDAAGTESFMSLLDTFGLDSNIFVISHKGQTLFDKFHSVIQVEKKNDFSIISSQPV